MDRIWSAISEIYISAAFEVSGRVYDPDRERARIERQIERLEWQSPSQLRTWANGPLVEGIARRNLRGLDAVAVGSLRCPDGAGEPVYSLVGLEGLLKGGGRVRLYALDTGSFPVALAFDSFAIAPPYGTQQARA